jgi:hypothetical protein
LRFASKNAGFSPLPYNPTQHVQTATGHNFGHSSDFAEIHQSLDLSPELFLISDRFCTNFPTP